MVDGILFLKANHRTRLLFSPLDNMEKIIDKFFPGSIFDNKLKDGEIEILLATPGKKNKIKKKSYHCDKCKMMLLFDND